MKTHEKSTTTYETEEGHKVVVDTGSSGAATLVLTLGTGQTRALGIEEAYKLGGALQSAALKAGYKVRR